jgi:hypothetical protein
MPHESSESWKFTKGMILSYLALTSTLINSGVITADAVLHELDRLISHFTTNYPDSIEIIETIKLTRDGISNTLTSNNSEDDTLWFSDFIGNA